MRSRILALSIVLSASGTLLLGCDDSSSSSATGPEAKIYASGRIDSLATASWEADTTLAIPAGVLGILTPTLTISNTLLDDFTFSGDLHLLNVYQGNNVEGAIYTRSGTWSVSGDSILVMAAQTCRQADTATVFGIAGIPFSMTFIANTLKSVPCGAPDTIRTRPFADGHWVVPMKVNMPGLATGTWSFDFVRQP